MQNIFDLRIREFEQMLRFQHKSFTTIKSYSANLRAFLISIQKTDVTEQDIRQYLDALMIKRVEHSTWNQIMYSLQRYYCDLMGNQWPYYIKKFRVKHKVKIIPPKNKILEGVRMMEGTDFDDIENVMQKKVGLLVFYDAQHRRGELQKQLIIDIDLNQKIMIIRNAKGGIEDKVEISEVTAIFIRQYLAIRKCKENPYLFSVPGTPDRYRSYSYMGDIVKEAGRLVGYQNWHPHLFRAAGSRHRFDETGDVVRSCRNLRHQKITTSMDYLNLKMGDLYMSQSPKNVPLLEKGKIGIDVKVNNH